jgi:colanic acid/amylovoran biosynthesis glycosyltransferase
VHILIFDGTFETTTFIRRLLQGLVKRGHQVVVIGFNLYNPNPVTGVQYYSLGSNQETRELITTSLKYQGVKALQAILSLDKKRLQEANLEKLLHRLQPDVIHAQWNSVLPWLEGYLERQEFPVVLSQRGYHTNVRPFVDSQNFAYLQQLYPKLSGLHSVSAAISNQGKKIGIPFTEIDMVVHTGLDLEKFPALKAYSKNESLHLISVGRAHWKKAYNDALKACALLKDKGIDFTYTIIGAGQDEELLYMIEAFALQNQVYLTGKLSSVAVYAEIQQASLFVLPSLEEGIANVAVEAMALGTPVISTNCGGMEELITHGKEGWIVPIRDPLALAEQIQAFTKLTEKEIESIRQAARLKVETNFNEAQMVIGMEGLYRQVLCSEE